jgi:hypothetical protein
MYGMGTSFHSWLFVQVQSFWLEGGVNVRNYLLRIIDRVLPRLSHINPSVVFGSIRLIVRYLDFLSNEDLIKNLIKKLAPSIVSVVSFTPV